MYLNHDKIRRLCEAGHIQNWSADCINAASLDVRLGDTLLVEACTETMQPVDYRARRRLCMREIKLTDAGYLVRPGEFFLAHTMERCNFPNDLAALFRIKSSMGRVGLEHLDAGWVDPGFNGALTLEFKNVTNYHELWIRPGDRIGQLVFLQGEAVSEDQSYRTKGNYNGHDAVAQVRYKEV